MNCELANVHNATQAQIKACQDIWSGVEANATSLPQGSIVWHIQTDWATIASQAVRDLDAIEATLIAIGVAIALYVVASIVDMLWWKDGDRIDPSRYFLAGGPSNLLADQNHPDGGAWDRNDPDRPSAKY